MRSLSLSLVALWASADLAAGYGIATRAVVDRPRVRAAPCWMRAAANAGPQHDDGGEEEQKLELHSWSRTTAPHKQIAAALAAVAAGAGAGALMMPQSAFAGAPVENAAPPAMKPLSTAAKKRLKKMLKNKMAKVPVFMVTNEGGSPFLNRLASGDQSALMFMFPTEAQKMLDGVLKAPNGASSGAKVLSTNLDRAFKLARLPPTPSGLRDQYSNRELTMVWQFMPHTEEQRAATFLMAKNAKFSAPAVPAYMVDGLVMTKRGKEVAPLFLSKKDCDAAVAILAESGEEAAAKIVVYDALGLLLELSTAVEAGDPGVEDSVKGLEIVPPSDSLDFREQLKQDKPKLHAKVVPPDRGAF